MPLTNGALESQRRNDGGAEEAVEAEALVEVGVVDPVAGRRRLLLLLGECRGASRGASSVDSMTAQSSPSRKLGLSSFCERGVIAFDLSLSLAN